VGAVSLKAGPSTDKRRAADCLQRPLLRRSRFRQQASFGAHAGHEFHRFLPGRGFAMKQSQFLSEEALIQRAIEVLLETLGPVETIRFLSLLVKQRAEFVKRHREWQSQLKKEPLFSEVFGARHR
jgi:hypothetical protein